MFNSLALHDRTEIIVFSIPEIPWLIFIAAEIYQSTKARSSGPSVTAWCNFHIASERFQWNLAESFIIPSPLPA